MSRQKITSIFLVMALVTSVFALPTVTVTSQVARVHDC